MAQTNGEARAKQAKRNIKVEDLPGDAKELSKDEMKAVEGGGFIDEVKEFFDEIVDGIKNLYQQKP